jgi:hypothetical protein
MDRAYGPLRIRFREYALRPWLLAQLGICLALLVAYLWSSAWVDTIDTTSWPLSDITSPLFHFSVLIPLGYSLTLSQEAFCAGSGRDRAQIVNVVLLPAALLVFLLTWALPAFVASQLGYPLV